MSEYTGKEIVILEGLEAVRKRPGMYIGSTGSRGLHHLIWEILDNSIDEHLAGFCDEIHITMRGDGGICIEDNGRGVPVDIHPTKKYRRCVWFIRYFMQEESLEILHTKYQAGCTV